MSTPRALLGNHPNPMVRTRGLGPDGSTCQTCRLRRVATGVAGRPFQVSVCELRSRTPTGMNNPRHYATWDACALFVGKTSSPIPAA